MVINRYFISKSQDGAVVAHWVHTPKVVGPIPTPASKKVRSGKYNEKIRTIQRKSVD